MTDFANAPPPRLERRSSGAPVLRLSQFSARTLCWTALAISVLRDGSWLSSERIRRIAIVFTAFMIAGLAFEFWIHTHPQWLAQHPGLKEGTGGLPLGEDFINYWAGAQLATHGHAAAVYDLKGFALFQRQHVASYADFRWYGYPPVALVLTSPLVFFPYLFGYFFWIAAGTFLCTFLFARQLRWSEAFFCAVAVPAFFYNTVGGQNGQFTAALLVGGILLLERRPLVSGLLFGVLCFKPQLGFLIPIALAAGGHWRSFAAAAAMVIALISISVLAFGLDTWAAFLSVAHYNVAVMEQNIMWHRMPTVFAAARLSGLDSSAAGVLQGVSSLAAITVTVAAWRGAADFRVKGAVLIIATILATPYAWDYDLMAVAFAIVWLWLYGARRGFSDWEKLALAATMAASVCAGSVAMATHVQIGPLLLWAALLFAVRHAVGSNPMVGILEMARDTAVTAPN